jgi:hypothetical protein
MKSTATPAGRKATGPIAAVFADEPWLYSYDLPDDRDITVKVEEVLKWDRLDLAGTTHRNVYGLKFAGKKKILLLTAKATFKAMAKLHGKTFEEWVGKEVTLYVDEVDAFGQTVDAIRIRTPKRGRSQAAQAGSDFLAGDPGPGAPPPGFGSETGQRERATEPVATTGPAEAGAVARDPDPSTERTDEQLFKALQQEAERATASFGGERLFIKQAPPKSGQWYACDAEVGSSKIYDATAARLAITRDELAAMSAKLQAIAA